MEFKIEESEEFIRIQKSINSMGNCEAKIGWFENNRYDDKNQTPVAYVALIQEKGAIIQKKNSVIIIPPRPFIEPSLKKNEKPLSDKLDEWSKQVLDGSLTVYKAFNKVAQSTKSAIQNGIKAVTSPPLSDSTIANRLAKRKNKKVTKTLSKPLIDTGLLFASVSIQVEEL